MQGTDVFLEDGESRGGLGCVAAMERWVLCECKERRSVLGESQVWA